MVAAASATLLDPPEFMRLMGNHLRWQLLSELTQGDLTVHELTERVGEPQNLISYHLAKLRDADVVTARRSSADGRDSYYSIDLERCGRQFAAAGAELHPALASGDPHPTGGTVAPKQVLFMCTGNSARSQMAEAFARHRSNGAVTPHSAGSHPKPLHPVAVSVMRDEHGIDIRAHVPEHLENYADHRFDRVVTLCDRVREVCPEFPGHPTSTHWSLPDPAAGVGELVAAFRAIAAEIEIRVHYLLVEMASSTIRTASTQRSTP